ncbi:MAG: cell division protein CrgA [Jiangellaceae bacterium]
MPKSRIRRKADFTPPQEQGSGGGGIGVSGRWVAPTMVTLLLLGLAWIVVFYIARDSIGFIDDLGGWNLVIGMGLITAGFITATKWK